MIHITCDRCGNEINDGFIKVTFQHSYSNSFEFNNQDLKPKSYEICSKCRKIMESSLQGGSKGLGFT